MTIFGSSGQYFVLRLHPGDDLKKSLSRIPKSVGSSAIAVVSCVGSLTCAALRFANQPDVTLIDGKFEIVSLTGTLSAEGVHLHLAISDQNGKTWGGHLGDGSLIYTTAELVLVDLTGLKFSRKVDSSTGFRELDIGHR